MKYHIDTIPVWDAVQQDCECPLCLLEHRLEDTFVDFYVGDSVMQPDMRQKSNESGFCAKHYQMMHDKKMKLPLGLTCQTRIDTLRDAYDQYFDSMIQVERKPKKDFSLNFFKLIRQHVDSCLICDRIDHEMERYYHTVIHMWKKETEFRNALDAGRGWCMHHFGHLVRRAEKDLMGKNRQTFLRDIAIVQKKNLQRISEEVQWFCDKFDHKNAQKPWGTSQDALPRAINKLSGRIPK